MDSMEKLLYNMEDTTRYYIGSQKELDDIIKEFEHLCNENGYTMFDKTHDVTYDSVLKGESLMYTMFDRHRHLCALKIWLGNDGYVRVDVKLVEYRKINEISLSRIQSFFKELKEKRQDDNDRIDAIKDSIINAEVDYEDAKMLYYYDFIYEINWLHESTRFRSVTRQFINKNVRYYRVGVECTLEILDTVAAVSEDEAERIFRKRISNDDILREHFIHVYTNGEPSIVRIKECNAPRIAPPTAAENHDLC